MILDHKLYNSTPIKLKICYILYILSPYWTPSEFN